MQGYPSEEEVLGRLDRHPGARARATRNSAPGRVGVQRGGGSPHEWGGHASFMVANWASAPGSSLHEPCGDPGKMVDRLLEKAGHSTCPSLGPS